MLALNPGSLSSFYTTSAYIKLASNPESEPGFEATFMYALVV